MNHKVNNTILNHLIKLHDNFYNNHIKSMLILADIENLNYFYDFKTICKKYENINIQNYKNYIIETLDLIEKYNCKSCVLVFFDCSLYITKETDVPTIITNYKNNIVEFIPLEENNIIVDGMINVYSFEEFKNTINNFNIKHYKELVENGVNYEY